MTPNIFAPRGNFKFNVSALIPGGANTIISATKSNITQPGILFIQSATATTFESVLGRWNPNTSLELYHGTIKTGGIGAMLYYVIFLY